MSDVAKAAKVSTSTVSRALAGDPRVKEETRHHIAEVAEGLGYTPNRTAAALRRGKTWMIGVVTPSTPRAFSDPFYLEFLGGLGDRVMEAGYNLVIAAPPRLEDASGSRPDGSTVPSAAVPPAERHSGGLGTSGRERSFPPEPSPSPERSLPPESSRSLERSLPPESSRSLERSLPRGSSSSPERSPAFVASRSPEPRHGLDLEGLVAQGAVDAVAVTEPAADDPRLAVLRSRGVPFAFLGMPEEGGRVPEDVPFVDGDNEGSSKEAVQHLIDLGHRRIACLTGATGLAATKQRLAGYLAALREAGIPIVDEWIVGGDSTKSGGRRAMEQLLALGAEQRPPGVPGIGVPSAVFAVNDLMAVGALRAAKDAGLRVPQDLSIVGFDGIPLGELVEPGLTTVKQPIYEFGRRLGDVLLWQLEGAEAEDRGERRIRTEIIPGRLTVRGSTGPPGTAAAVTADANRPTKGVVRGG